MSARLNNTNAVLSTLNGSPQYQGSIVTTSTSAKNNSDTAATFALNGGRSYLVQPNAGCYVLAKTTSAGAVTAAEGVYLAANERIVITTKSDESYISIIRESADVTLKVWELV